MRSIKTSFKVLDTSSAKLDKAMSRQRHRFVTSRIATENEERMEEEDLAFFHQAAAPRASRPRQLPRWRQAMRSRPATACGREGRSAAPAPASASMAEEGACSVAGLRGAPTILREGTDDEEDDESSQSSWDEAEAENWDTHLFHERLLAFGGGSAARSSGLARQPSRFSATVPAVVSVASLPSPRAAVAPVASLVTSTASATRISRRRHAAPSTPRFQACVVADRPFSAPRVRRSTPTPLGLGATAAVARPRSAGTRRGHMGHQAGAEGGPAAPAASAAKAAPAAADALGAAIPLHRPWPPSPAQPPPTQPTQPPTQTSPPSLTAPAASEAAAPPADAAGDDVASEMAAAVAAATARRRQQQRQQRLRTAGRLHSTFTAPQRRQAQHVPRERPPVAPLGDPQARTMQEASAVVDPVF